MKFPTPATMTCSQRPWLLCVFGKTPNCF